MVIVQTDRANAHSPHTIMVPFTSKIRNKLLPSHVLVPTGEGGLTQDSVALCEQIRVIDTTRLLVQIGQLSTARIVELDQALREVLEI